MYRKFAFVDLEVSHFCSITITVFYSSPLQENFLHILYAYSRCSGLSIENYSECGLPKCKTNKPPLVRNPKLHLNYGLEQ